MNYNKLFYIYFDLMHNTGSYDLIVKLNVTLNKHFLID